MTERLARTCAAHPRRTLALWGVAVVVAMAFVATSLHGLSTQAHVIGNPQSVAATDAIAKAFPKLAAQTKQDVVVFSSSRYTVTSPQAHAFGVRLLSVIRSVVLPAALGLLDSRSWYLPRWLGWLPHVEVEGPVEAAGT